MKKLFISTLINLFLISHSLFAQSITAGHISFEKKINVYALWKHNANENTKKLADAYAPESGKQFVLATYDLYFDAHQSLYIPFPRKADTDPNISTLTMGGMNNKIGIDAAKNRTAQKDLFGEKFLIKDELPKIKWKITSETKEIAGYTCRRANGLMMDSVYVVAFYTTDIPVKCGPESFNGLPGMILGVALPHQYTSWFASKVQLGDFSTKIIQPKEGKPQSAAQFKETVMDLLRRYNLKDPWILQAFLL